MKGIRSNHKVSGMESMKMKCNGKQKAVKHFDGGCFFFFGLVIVHDGLKRKWRKKTENG